MPPFLFVIFGAGGDLSDRKLLPALYHLMGRHSDLRSCHILGVARTPRTDDQFRREVREVLAEHGFAGETSHHWCDTNVAYESLGEAGNDYDRIEQRIREIEQAHHLPENRVYYLALPPVGFEPTVRALGERGLGRSAGWIRLVVEKPFGHDFASGRSLNELVHAYFDEAQIFRIDHYLGKETVQNLLVFRFANALFESVWNRDRIERVEILVEERLGVEERGKYYDKSGALRDMVQNHLTQLLCLVAMDAPTRFDAAAIGREKLKVLESIRPLRRADVVLGQYAAGTIDGATVPGYRDEAGVPADSLTPTFVELSLEISNWRWQGVPFVIRTGKRMPERRTQIIIHFRPAPISIFQPFEKTCDLSPNRLVFTLQPDEGFDLSFEVKEPGDAFSLATQTLHFRYDEVYDPLREAYETLLLDVLRGDQTLFVDADWVEASWKLYEPVLRDGLDLRLYAAGSAGPVKES